MAYELDFIGVNKKTDDATAIGIRWKNPDGSYTVGVFDGGTADYGEALKEHMKKYYFDGKDGGHIDFVICSHPHNDHASGLATILENFDVGKLYMNCPWDYVDELHAKDGRITQESLERRLREAYSKTDKLEQIARERGIEICSVFEGDVIEEKLTVLSPSKEFYLDMIAESAKTPEMESASLIHSAVHFVKKVINYIAESWGVDSIRENVQTESDNETSTMFTALDKLVASELPQMDLYCEIGRLVSGRSEKGAAVAAAEYLLSVRPNVPGFSPRNLRRMREFYRAYECDPEVLAQATTIGWTQNVVILEAELTTQERAWYIWAVQKFGWSKVELQRQVAGGAHLEIALDFTDEVCYTEEKPNSEENLGVGIKSDRAGTNRVYRNQNRQGDLMKNYCDYDAIKLYHSGEFNFKYKTDLTGKLQPAECIPYGKQITDSFKDGIYQTFRTKEPIVLYRVFGQYWSDGRAQPRGAKLNGGFASTEFAESIIDAKLRLALDPTWANTKMYEERLIVPTDTTISIGIVASVTLKTGTILPGGADQILLPQGWPESWITGYRRLTSRQLQSLPYFSMQKPPEYDKKESLYSIICPACGCEECRRLVDEEQFTITGSKGNPYTMRYTCLNPGCQYYW